MKPPQVSIIGWIVVGALVTVLGVAALRAYIIVSGGYSVSDVPVMQLLFRVMELHWFALYGAVGGLVLGGLEKLYRFLRYRDWSSKPRYRELLDTPDDMIKADRARRADEYLKATQGEHAQRPFPEVENIITERNGQLTYCVVAYHTLSHEEMAKAVRQALIDGEIKKPEPGGISILVTDIGKPLAML